jgi:hypothetical protein
MGCRAAKYLTPNTNAGMERRLSVMASCSGACALPTLKARLVVVSAAENTSCRAVMTCHRGKAIAVLISKMLLHARLAFAAIPLLVSFPADAQRTGAGPFAALSGTWSGSGTVTLSNGSAERIRCRAAYAPESGGNALRSNLRCASDSSRFDLTSQVVSNGGPISGRWVETTRNATGFVSGTASGDHIEVRVEGGFFTASMTLVTRGDRQSVTIVSPGSELRQVSITLRRGGG